MIVGYSILGFYPMEVMHSFKFIQATCPNSERWWDLDSRGKWKLLSHAMNVHRCNRIKLSIKCWWTVVIAYQWHSGNESTIKNFVVTCFVSPPPQQARQLRTALSPQRWAVWWHPHHSPHPADRPPLPADETGLPGWKTKQHMCKASLLALM